MTKITDTSTPVAVLTLLTPLLPLTVPAADCVGTFGIQLISVGVALKNPYTSWNDPVSFGVAPSTTKNT
jgi:hypothetical protein